MAFLCIWAESCGKHAAAGISPAGLASLPARDKFLSDMTCAQADKALQRGMSVADVCRVVGAYPNHCQYDRESVFYNLRDGNLECLFPWEHGTRKKLSEWHLDVHTRKSGNQPA
jgi:hypothetical protein